MTALLTAPPIAARPYQQEALAAIRAAYAERGIRRQLVALPTGTGKTIVFAQVLSQRRGRALILAHRDELISQAVGKLHLVLGETPRSVGVVKAARNEIDADIVVGSVQTLSQPRRLEQLASDFRTCIVDEAHHAAAASYRRILQHVGAFAADGPLTLGVTATPERSDKVGLHCVFQEIVYERDLLSMVQAGYLVDLRALWIHTGADLDHVQRRGGDFTDGALGDALLAANAPDQVVAAFLEHAAERKAVCFTPTIAVAHAIADAFRAAGVPAAAVDGGTPLDERRAILQRFERGALRVLANCQVFTEGWDCPSVDCVIIARPTSSRSFYLQMLGRGTRLFPGKQDCLILDVVGVSTRHDVLTAASLFGLPPQALASSTVTAAVAEQEAQAEIAAGGGRLVAQAVELFARRELRWIHAGAGFVLSAGDSRYVLSPDDGGQAWTIFHQTRDTQTVVRQGLPLTYAQGLAEDLVRAAGRLHLVDPRATWRQQPPTEKQIAALRRAGQRVPTTRGEASDKLAAVFATLPGGRRVG